MTLLHPFLSRGFFPRELPPPFTTEPFASAISKNKRRLPSSFTSDRKFAKLCQHSVARVNLLRRRMSIPNPVLYYNLCLEIADNWDDLRSHCLKSDISKSIPTKGGSHGRSIVPSHSHADLKLFRSNLRTTAKYILKTDIGRFYPSIYSHSIPWAIHTKPFAKSHRGSNYIGNRLDKWVRNCQDGQTIGIPIGPDTSLVIAEIILSPIDVEIRKHLPSTRIYRHVDDYEFGFKSFSEAEEALALLHEILNEFQLEVNSNKTEILELPLPLESDWVYELRNFEFHSSPRKQKSDLIKYFDRAVILSKKYSQDHVLKYAVQKLQSFRVDKKNFELLEQFLIQCIMNETGTFIPVLKQLTDYHNEGMNIDLSTLEEVLNYQIETQCPVGHGSEAAWAIWSSIFWSLPISTTAAQKLSKMNDSVVALLALDAFNSKLIDTGLDTSSWETLMKTDELYNEHWLLTYEANFKNWLPSKGGKDHVSMDSNFDFLKKQGVYFYDKRKARSVTFTGAPISEGTSPLFSF